MYWEQLLQLLVQQNFLCLRCCSRCICFNNYYYFNWSSLLLIKSCWSCRSNYIAKNFLIHNYPHMQDNWLVRLATLMINVWLSGSWVKIIQNSVIIAIHPTKHETLMIIILCSKDVLLVILYITALSVTKSYFLESFPW